MVEVQGRDLASSANQLAMKKLQYLLELQSGWHGLHAVMLKVDVENLKRLQGIFFKYVFLWAACVPLVRRIR